MEAKLLGQAALVTGASSGLGRAAAIALAGSGADVALLARSAEDLEDTASEISTAGHRALPLPVDLADDAAIQACGYPRGGGPRSRGRARQRRRNRCPGTGG